MRLYDAYKRFGFAYILRQWFPRTIVTSLMDVTLGFPRSRFGVVYTMPWCAWGLVWAIWIASVVFTWAMAIAYGSWANLSAHVVAFMATCMLCSVYGIWAAHGVVSMTMNGVFLGLFDWSIAAVLVTELGFLVRWMLRLPPYPHKLQKLVGIYHDTYDYDGGVEMPQAKLYRNAIGWALDDQDVMEADPRLCVENGTWYYTRMPTDAEDVAVQSYPPAVRVAPNGLLTVVEPKDEVRTARRGPSLLQKCLLYVRTQMKVLPRFNAANLICVAGHIGTFLDKQPDLRFAAALKLRRDASILAFLPTRGDHFAVDILADPLIQQLMTQHQLFAQG